MPRYRHQRHLLGVRCRSKKIWRLKANTPHVVCQGLPPIFDELLVFCSGLAFKQRPDYKRWTGEFTALAGVKESSVLGSENKLSRQPRAKRITDVRLPMVLPPEMLPDIPNVDHVQIDARNQAT